MEEQKAKIGGGGGARNWTGRGKEGKGEEVGEGGCLSWEGRKMETVDRGPLQAQAKVRRGPGAAERRATEPEE